MFSNSWFFEQFLSVCFKRFAGRTPYRENWKIIKVWKEVAHVDQKFSDLWNSLVNRIIARIQKNIETSICKGKCREVDVVIASKALAGMVEHYVNNILIQDEELDIKKSANTLAKLWYHALNYD